MGMTDLSANAMGDAHISQPWPLTSIVRIQLAVTSVWAPYLLGWLLVLTAATAQFVLEEEPLARAGAAHHDLTWELTYWCGVILGVVVVPIAQPRAWPAAARIQPVRRIAASLLGAGAVLAVALVTRQMAPFSESSVLVGLLALATTTLGAALVWPILRAGA